NENIEATVVNIATIKPLDNELIVSLAKNIGKVVTAEEHSIIGGLGSAVAEVLSEECPVRLKRIGLKDVFGQSGAPDILLKHYGLTSQDIVKAAKAF
uniref:transketolase C-terminal domain-containing protein n=1 Tax=Clostridium sp. TaxID=1506 RepID=UPI00260392A5